MNKYKSVIFIGPPGANKTRVGRKLSEDYKHFFHFSTGEIIRSLDEEIFVCEQVNNVMKARKYISTKYINEIQRLFIGRAVWERNYKPDKQTIILDGVPRNKVQFKDIKRRFNIEKILVFNLTDEESIRRCLTRNEGEIRLDDLGGIEVIKAGIHQFKCYTKPILNIVESEIVYHIDAMGTKDEVYQRVKDVVLS